MSFGPSPAFSPMGPVEPIGGFGPDPMAPVIGETGYGRHTFKEVGFYDGYGLNTSFNDAYLHPADGMGYNQHMSAPVPEPWTPPIRPVVHEIPMVARPPLLLRDELTRPHIPSCQPVRIPIYKPPEPTFPTFEPVEMPTRESFKPILPEIKPFEIPAYEPPGLTFPIEPVKIPTCEPPEPFVPPTVLPLFLQKQDEPKVEIFPGVKRITPNDQSTIIAGTDWGCHIHANFQGNLFDARISFDKEPQIEGQKPIGHHVDSFSERVDFFLPKWMRES